MTVTCSIDGCPHPHSGRGWCMAHYNRWRKHGDPLAGGPLRQRTPKQLPTCAAEGCDLTVHARGYCGRHYRRLKKTGSIELPTVIDRFWDRVDKTSHEGGCWIWTGALSRSGYGQFCVTKTIVVAPHRFVYELEVAPIPAGFAIDHTCRNRACVFPGYLAAVTATENSLRIYMDAEKHAALREVVRRPNVVTLSDEVFALALSAASEAGIPVDRMVSDCVTAVLAEQEARVA